MSEGQVYVWTPCEDEFTGGSVRLDRVRLAHLDKASPSDTRLSGRFVEVVNRGWVAEPGRSSKVLSCRPIGSARPDRRGNFLWEPAAGGGRRLKKGVNVAADQEAGVSAGHFGEVNAYYHLTRIGEHFEALLSQLGEKPLPRVRAVVNAHRNPDGPVKRREAAQDANGKAWEPIRNSRYLTSSSSDMPEEAGMRVACSGEILLSPGLRMSKEGWLPRIANTPYRCNAAHIAGHLYRQYAFHATRHTADFMANGLEPPARQTNTKTPTASAISDYWAASMLGTPHVWCWHHRHDNHVLHPRSLAANATMADFERETAPEGVKPATVLAAALWDLRNLLQRQGDSNCDLLVLAALLSVRRLCDDPFGPDPTQTRRLRNGFETFAACLLHADAIRFGGVYKECITQAMQRRGIAISDTILDRLAAPDIPPLDSEALEASDLQQHCEKIRTRFPEAIIPADDDLLSPEDLEAHLRDRPEIQFDLAGVGDVMTGMRLRHRISRFGPNYVSAWVKPLLDRASVLVGNLEGPFAAQAELKDTTRNFSYKVDPRSAVVLRRAGFQAMTIANNHIMDCGRKGVRETLAALDEQGIAAIGGGLDESCAHMPAIFGTRGGRIGLLGYYWNRRTAARAKLPGSARDLPDLVERDIGRLRPHVDRVAVTVHWGVPYEREPLAEDRLKARHFIDCGADIVIGHHPHIIQPLEIYRGRPIFYSVGNFTFGSGNSRAESLLVAVRFADDGMQVYVYPVYVQNRDPRLNYQPKILRGAAASQTLRRLATISGRDGERLLVHDHYASLEVPKETAQELAGEMESA